MTDASHGPAGEAGDMPGASAFTSAHPPPGFWVLDDHVDEPRGTFGDALFNQPFSDGFSTGFERYGMLAETIEGAVVDGWFYTGFRPLTAPDRLRARATFAATHDVLALLEAAARDHLDRLGPLEEERQLLGAGLDALSDAALAGRVERCAHRLGELIRERFADIAIGSLIAEYVLRAGEVAGWDDRTAIKALGSVPASAGVASTVSALAAALKAHAPDLAEGLATGKSVSIDELLDAIAGSEAAAMYERDRDILFKLSPRLPTLGERPDVVIELVRTHLDAPTKVVEVDELIEVSELAGAAAAARLGQTWRDDSNAMLLRWMGLARRVALEAGRRLVARSALTDPQLVFDLEPAELAGALRDPDTARTVAAVARERSATRRRQAEAVPPPLLGDPPTTRPGPPPGVELPAAARRNMARIGWLTERLGGPAGPPQVGADGIRGVGASAGTYEGTARVLRGPDDFDRFEVGDVLVCRATSPAWNAVMAIAGAVVSDFGGLVGHTALTARELGVPAVVGTKVATVVVRDGQRVAVDGGSGLVSVLDG